MTLKLSNPNPWRRAFSPAMFKRLSQLTMQTLMLLIAFAGLVAAGLFGGLPFAIARSLEMMGARDIFTGLAAFGVTAICFVLFWFWISGEMYLFTEEESVPPQPETSAVTPPPSVAD